jgi:integrase
MRLSAAVVLVLDPVNGKYPGDSPWKRSVASYLTTCVELLEDPEIGDVKHAHYRTLWRKLAELHAADPTRYGPRSIEMIVGALRGAMGWLQLEEHIESTAGLPAPRWKSQMQRDWMHITNEPPRRKAKPRATKDEQAAIFAALHLADPRAGLAIQIGAELRLGQVVRARRSDIYEYDGHEIGGIIIHGRGHKHGADVLFTDQQREAVTRALTTGFLSNVESAYRAGSISDYLLTAGGYLAKQKAQVGNAMKPLSAKALRDYWNDLEQLAGVQHVRGRGWYALRRRAADDAEDVSTDERALNEFGGWTDSNTRRGYQEQGRIDVKEKTRDIRAAIRPSVNA